MSLVNPKFRHPRDEIVNPDTGQICIRINENDERTIYMYSGSDWLKLSTTNDND